MYSPLGEMRTERMVIFGGPVCGFGLLALGAIALPPQAFGLAFFSTDVIAVSTAAGVALLALLVLPLLYWVLIFIPLPDFLYPRWAREVRADRRRFPQTSPHQPPHRSRSRTCVESSTSPTPTPSILIAVSACASSHDREQHRAGHRIHYTLRRSPSEEVTVRGLGLRKQPPTAELAEAGQVTRLRQWPPGALRVRWC